MRAYRGGAGGDNEVVGKAKAANATVFHADADLAGAGKLGDLEFFE